MMKQRRPTGPIGRWPTHVRGGETPLDRSRTIARGAVQALAAVDPRAAEQIVATADAFGETWLRTSLDPGCEDDEILTAVEAGLLVGRRPTTIRKWSERYPERLPRVNGGYRKRDVLEMMRIRDLTVPDAA